MKLYISGPITGTNDYMERFAAAQKELEEEGWSVINPALVNSNLPKDTEWEDYMEMAVCMLNMCEVVYFLDGWEKSRGANIEYGYALAKGKDIMFQKEYEEYRPNKSALEDLKNWPETAKGIHTHLQKTHGMRYIFSTSRRAGILRRRKQVCILLHTGRIIMSQKLTVIFTESAFWLKGQFLNVC